MSTRVKNEFRVKTVIFYQNRVHRVNTGQTMSTRVKNEFRAVSGQNCHFDQNRVHRVNTGQTMSTRVKNEFRVKTVIFDQNRVHRVNTGQTMSTRIKNEFHVVLGQTCYFLVKTRSTRFISIESFFFLMFQHNFR